MSDSLKKRKILLDCDPGHDDAVAIMLAAGAPQLELVGISTVAGNQTLEKTTSNALHVFQHLNLHYPVYAGCSRPLVRERAIIAADIHGKSGLDGPHFEKLNLQKENRHAVLWIIDTLMNAPEPMTVVTCGPMTNLALAMRLEPRIVEKIETYVFMGGSYQLGNVTPAAEFNILADPEAAHIIFTSGIRELVMVGLDVTRQCLCLPEVVERMAKIPNKAARLFADMMRFFNASQKATFGWPGGPLHDPLTVAWLIRPELLTLRHVHGEVDISHGPSYGRTNCDYLNYQKKEPNLYLATEVDVHAYWDLLEEILCRYSGEEVLK